MSFDHLINGARFPLASAASASAGRFRVVAARRAQALSLFVARRSLSGLAAGLRLQAARRLRERLDCVARFLSRSSAIYFPCMAIRPFRSANRFASLELLLFRRAKAASEKEFGFAGGSEFPNAAASASPACRSLYSRLASPFRSRYSVIQRLAERFFEKRRPRDEILSLGKRPTAKCGELGPIAADPAKQLEFKENFSSTFLEAAPGGTELGRIEARAGMKGMSSRVRAPRNARPCAVRDQHCG